MNQLLDALQPLPEGRGRQRVERGRQIAGESTVARGRGRRGSVWAQPSARAARAGDGGRGRGAGCGVEPDAARAEEAAKQYGIPVFASVDELLRADLKLDAACVAVPDGEAS